MRKLSVIVPLYNKANYVEQCINSILKQNYGDLEIIIVDDGSTDGGGEICDAIAKRDNRINVIHKKNQGVVEARYTGLKECSSDYVTFVDADDFIIEDAYYDTFRYMDMDIDMIVYEISRYYGQNNVKTEKHRIRSGYYNRERIDNLVLDKLIWNLAENTRGVECSLCIRVIKKDILLKRYEKTKIQVHYGEDPLITYPLFLDIESMQVIPRSYYMHRQYNSESWSYVISDTFFDECFQIYKYFDKVFAEQDSKYNFKQQIEYFYIEAVKLKKTKYKDNRDFFYFIFPFELTLPNKKIVLYGAGRVGKDYYNQISSIHYCKELLWVDKNAKRINDDRVHEVEEIMYYNYDYIVIAINDNNVCIDIKNMLMNQGIEEKKIIYRELFHG